MRSTSINKNPIHAYDIFIISCKRLLFSHQPSSHLTVLNSEFYFDDSINSPISNTKCPVYWPVCIDWFSQCMFAERIYLWGPVLDIGWYELCLHRAYNHGAKQMYTDESTEQDKTSFWVYKYIILSLQRQCFEDMANEAGAMYFH